MGTAQQDWTVGKMSDTEQEPREDFGASRDEETPEGVDPETGEIAEQTPQEAADADGSDALIKKAEKARANFTRRIREIFGDNAPPYDCPDCDGLGLKWDDPAAGIALVQADDAEPCEKCDAKGQTATGSKVPGQDAKPCGRCGGRGWHEKAYAPENVTPIVRDELTYQGHPQTPVMGWRQPDGTFVPLGTPQAGNG